MQEIKRTKTTWVINSILLISLFIMNSCTNETQQNDAIDKGIATSFESLIEFQEKEFFADSGLVYVHPLGSKISIPAESIIDEKGNTVQGKVNLEYREVHTAEEILLSGIPMQMDQDANTYLSSGGMMEIHVTQNGKKLFLADNKEIDIELVTEVNTKENYELFQLDDNSTWGDGTSFEQKPNTRRDSILAVTKKSIATINDTFEIKTYFELRPYIRMWKDVDWRMINCKSELPWSEVNEVIWDYVQVTRAKSSSKIHCIEIVSTMHSYNGITKQWQAKIYAEPLLDDKRLAQLRERQIKEDKRREAKFAKLDAEAKDLARNQKKFEAEMLAAYEEENRINLARMLEREQRLKAQRQTVSSFKIGGFGIYNIDRLYHMQKYGSFLAAFDFEKDENISPKVYLILEDQKSVINLWPGAKIPAMDTKCSIVCVSKEGDCRKVTIEEFSKKVTRQTAEFKKENIITFKTIPFKPRSNALALKQSQRSSTPSFR